ncbi:MAG: glycosyltransferase family 2 protein [Phycisphaerales bacterium]|nr:MAG: glycosyltransferase family 2 protein [Phycisphaerales bacterium]
MPEHTLHYTLYGLYAAVMLMICVYGLHRYHLVYLYYKHARNVPKPPKRFHELPLVTIQLPMFNERYVARRIIESTCRIEYPRDRLQIQVLDDSTDDTVRIAGEAVERMRRAGHNVVYRHRTNRQGYKAGALDEGLATATGEFVCIFDADFVPTPEILLDAIHYFNDPKIGMVQARWEHINREQSLLTKTQAVLLDGHFVMEHGARNRSGRFMSFNGTAGIWRKCCIEDAGGWQHDTLTEDLDLSYRAQLKGWRFVFLPGIASPAELPPEMSAFKAQQHRWAKGGAQTCRKLLPKILRSRLPIRIKVEAFFHLTSCTVYLYMVALTVLLLPLLLLRWGGQPGSPFRVYLIDVSLFIVASCSASSFYVCSQRELNRTWADSLKYLPFLMALGIGICFSNAIATLQGFFGKPSEFVRTPKFGLESPHERSWVKRNRYARRRRKLPWLPIVEIIMGINMLCCLVLCIRSGWITIGALFMSLFTVGFLYVGLTTLLGTWPAVAAARSAPDPKPDGTADAGSVAVPASSKQQP